MTTRRMIRSASKSSYISVNRGLALLDEAIEQIELQVKRPRGGDWNQGAWRCDTGMCLAGWAAQLAGGRWAFGAADDNPDALLATDDDSAEIVYDYEGKRCVDARDRAQELLGLNDYQADELFGGDNEIEDITRLRNHFAETMSD